MAARSARVVKQRVRDAGELQAVVQVFPCFREEIPDEVQRGDLQMDDLLIDRFVVVGDLFVDNLVDSREHELGDEEGVLVIAVVKGSV